MYNYGAQADRAEEQQQVTVAQAAVVVDTLSV